MFRVAVLDTPLSDFDTNNYNITIHDTGTRLPASAEAINKRHGDSVMSIMLSGVDKDMLSIDYFPLLNADGSCTADELLLTLMQVGTNNFDLVLLCLAFPSGKYDQIIHQQLQAIDEKGACILASAFNEGNQLGSLALSQHAFGIVHHPNIPKGRYKLLKKNSRLLFMNCAEIPCTLNGESLSLQGTSFGVPLIARQWIMDSKLQLELSS
ncbi:hypothetical protein RB981_002712 [Vibrio cholerae]|jgi:hypothetical protein|uniref:hypothetical protein n=1 Tax=Vibrio cholerae TaxID=666 RepID=UPI0011DBCACB|nr:hypothetical protein [Vibrio cholerae]ELE7141944.1 hypothetical protein [Vibrio cholerae]MCR9707119.1 hypothetical protein [Vibrio cholerae]MCR9871750.1 hypothetical protein [Vibrio cholerae]TXZ95514.1 hypothetical protein FXE30_02555 [Vibrio cholerae]